MDPNSVLDELAAIGVFDVPKPTVSVAPAEKPLLDDTPVPVQVPVHPDMRGLIAQSIQHAEGLLASLCELQRVSEGASERTELEAEPKGVRPVSEPKASVSLPSVQNSPAYQAALESALQKIKGEAHLVEDPPPVARESERTGFIRPPSPDGESDVFVGSSAGRVKPADPSEFVSVGKGN